MNKSGGANSEMVFSFVLCAQRGLPSVIQKKKPLAKPVNRVTTVLVIKC